jgi:hypothetical protein
LTLKYNIQPESLKERDHFESQASACKLDPAGSGQDTMPGCSRTGSDPSGFITDRDIIMCVIVNISGTMLHGVKRFGNKIRDSDPR